MRQTLIAGNWKMNLNLTEGRALVEGLKAELAKLDLPSGFEVAVCPPAVYLLPVAGACDGSPIVLGAQDVYHEPRGAFTGEIAPAMIAETGARYVIIGHSERRHTIGHLEDDRIINLKLRAARGVGLTPILCIGETLAERQAEQTLDVLTFQLTAGLVGVSCEQPSELVIAYEPVWAIGTGHTATPQQAQEAHAHIRSELVRLLGPVGQEVRILYGGSVKPDNARELVGQPDVDGALVGGASLKVESFAGIIREALAAVG